MTNLSAVSVSEKRTILVYVRPAADAAAKITVSPTLASPRG
jgi:hypothetical protein